MKEKGTKHKSIEIGSVFTTSLFLLLVSFLICVSTIGYWVWVLFVFLISTLLLYYVFYFNPIVEDDLSNWIKKRWISESGRYYNDGTRLFWMFFQLLYNGFRRYVYLAVGRPNSFAGHIFKSLIVAAFYSFLLILPLLIVAIILDYRSLSSLLV